MSNWRDELWRKEAQRKIDIMPEKAKEIREAAKDDLWLFAQLVNPGRVYGSVHKEVFKWLQDNNEQNQLLLLPRAHMKSHCVAVWVAWWVTKHPETSILYVSATAELAEKQLYDIKNIFISDVYRQFYPEYFNPEEGKREKWAVSKVAVDHEKRRIEGVRDWTIASAGLTTNTTGWHADVIVADDVVVPDNAYTEDARTKVSSAMSQMISIRNAGGFTKACGTRYHPADIYSIWKKQEYPVYDEESDDILSYVSVWDIKEHPVETNGDFLWPRSSRADGKRFGFDRKELARIRAEYEDQVQFYAQYYNDPNDPGSQRIDRSRFQYYDKKKLYREGMNWYFDGDKLNVYAAIDFAFSLKKRADFTAIVVIGIASDGNIYVLDIDRFKTDKIIDYFKHLSKLHSHWGFKRLRAEVTVAQQIIVNDLKDYIKSDGLRLSIDEHRPSSRDGSKEERMAAALEHRYENQAMWHFEGGHIAILEEELVMARPQHDDVKDALACAVEIAIKPMGSRSSRNNNVTHVNFNRRFGGITF